MSSSPTPFRFMDLPNAVRKEIYKLCLVYDGSITFALRYYKIECAAILRTCHRCNIEGTPILYGENIFDFPRWGDIQPGDKRNERFTANTGPGNTSMFRNLAFCEADLLLGGVFL
jgi:hypothetical protein